MPAPIHPNYNFKVNHKKRDNHYSMNTAASYENMYGMPWHYLLIQICPLWRLPVNAVMTTAIIFLIHLKKLLVFLR